MVSESWQFSKLSLFKLIIRCSEWKGWFEWLWQLSDGGSGGGGILGKAIFLLLFNNWGSDNLNAYTKRQNTLFCVGPRVNNFLWPVPINLADRYWRYQSAKMRVFLSVCLLLVSVQALKVLQIVPGFTNSHVLFNYRLSETLRYCNLLQKSYQLGPWDMKYACGLKWRWLCWIQEITNYRKECGKREY